jgi:hypothetical protein
VYRVSVNQFGSPGINASPEFVKATRLGVGLYDVFFSVSIDRCGRVASLGLPTGTRDNSAALTPPPGEISTQAELIDRDTGAFVDNVLTVGTFDSTGNPADKPFHLMVSC